jgi:hypothetical protein
VAVGCMVDEDGLCSLYISSTGNDSLANGNFSLPFRTIEGALNKVNESAIGVRLNFILSGIYYANSMGFNITKFKSLFFQGLDPNVTLSLAFTMNGVNLTFQNVSFQRINTTGISSIIFNNTQFNSTLDSYVDANLVIINNSSLMGINGSITFSSKATILSNFTCGNNNLTAQSLFYTNSLNISSSFFYNNTADQKLLQTVSHPSQINIQTSTFENNTANPLIYISSSPTSYSILSITNTSFLKNQWTFNSYLLIYAPYVNTTLMNVLFSCNMDPHGIYSPPVFSSGLSVMVNNVTSAENCPITCGNNDEVYPLYGILNICTSCKHGYVPNADFSSCVACQAGTFSFGQMCVPCPGYSYQPNAAMDECTCFGFAVRDPNSIACNNYVFLVTVIVLLGSGVILILLALYLKKRDQHETVIIEYKAMKYN